MIEQLKEAGFSKIKSKNMMPEGAYFYFCGEA
jgi:hypothetical protein